MGSKVALVTGGGSGIGRAVAIALADNGYRVTVAGRRLPQLEETAAASKGEMLPLSVDVTDAAAVSDMVARTVARFGRLDVLFNNAGIAQVRTFLDITEEDWRNVMDVNGLGVLIGMQEAARQMIAQGTGGSIVNTASIAGKQGYEPLAHYSASKFAVVGFAEALQLTEYGVGGHFDWHLDIGPEDAASRKLSLTVLMNAPSEYDGGQLEFFRMGSVPPDLTIGTALFFPSYLPHRVAPVTRGIRRSLVAWAYGNSFR